MPKSLASRLMLSFLTIIIVVIMLLGIMLNYIFQDYYYKEKVKTLITHGHEVSKVVTDYLQGQIDWKTMNKELEDKENYLNAEIVILDTKGEEYSELRPYEHFAEEDPFTKEEWTKVIAGQVIYKDTKSLILDSDTTLSVAVPIQYNGKYIGAVSFHSTVYDIQNSMVQIQKFILVAAITAIIIAAFFTYFLTKHITNPLKQINKEALKIAKGEFATKITVKGEDEISQLAKNFNYMADELKKTEQIRRDFISNVSHELRSPITFISGLLESINDKKIQNLDAMEEHVVAALDKTSNMSRLIQELLDLSSIEANTFTLYKSKIDINETLRRVIVQMAAIFEKKNFEIIVDISDEPIWIMADSFRMEQIFTNLLDNATKFTQMGGKIKAKTIKKKNKAIILISDTGCGISEQDIPFIWDRFYKVDKVRTPGPGGTGLGLAIVKELVKAHEGEIEVSSKLNQGTTFMITLPI